LPDPGPREGPPAPRQVPALAAVPARLLLSLLLAGLVTLSWSGVLDARAEAGARDTLARAFATWAVARGLNGVISVAQGTEVAIQPVGVGVTITAGEILDPLNDLVERFSELALVATASLGLQLLLTELAHNPWLSVLVTAAAALAVACLWWPRPFALRPVLLRLCLLALFARFVVAGVTGVCAWIDETVLAERQRAALDNIARTQQAIEALETTPKAAAGERGGLLDRFNALLDDTGETLDVERRLQALKARVESAVGEVVNLIVLFVLQTLLLPVGTLWLAWRGFGWLWRWSWRAGTGPAPAV